MKALRNGALGVLLCAATVQAASGDYERALELYQRTEYRQAITALGSPKPPAKSDSKTLQLQGQCYFGLADYKKATEIFEEAVVLAPGRSELFHWLGRAYGRRAETGSLLTALGNASKARQFFEKAVELDPSNQEAVNDLFDYYLEAPGFLGGGMDKAEHLAKHIETLDAAEGHYAQARLHDKRKEYKDAEHHLRTAAELSPMEVGRVLDQAKYLAKLGRHNESDVLFLQAFKLAPDSPKVLFDRAETYVEARRNLPEARAMLEKYLKSNLTPDDPPRSAAEALLRRIPK